MLYNQEEDIFPPPAPLPFAAAGGGGGADEVETFLSTNILLRNACTRWSPKDKIEYDMTRKKIQTKGLTCASVNGLKNLHPFPWK